MPGSNAIGRRASKASASAVGGRSASPGKLERMVVQYRLRYPD
jgi:hypothetical protein